MGNDTETQPTATLILHLDAGGNVVRTEWEPATHETARAACLTQTRELLHRANALAWTIESHAGGNESIDNLKRCAELAAMKDAVRDLRPYLALVPKRIGEAAVLPPVARESFRRSA